MDDLSPGLLLGDRVAWDGDRLVVTDDELLEKVDKPYLSPSTSKAMQSCPSRMVAERAQPSRFDLFGAAEKGTAAHTVLERLFGLPAGRRDEQRAARILTELARDEPIDGDPDYAQAIGADPVRNTQWVAAVSAAYSGIFAIEDPRDVTVLHTELRLDGVDVAGVPFKGFIDRVDETPKGPKVVDFKTGKDLSRPNPRFDDDHGDQIRLYVAGYEAKTGERPAAGYLYYIQHGKQRRVAISKTEVNKSKRVFADSWRKLQAAVSTRTFETKDSALCGWCPLVNACPTAKANGRVDRKGGAPTAVELGIPTVGPAGVLIPAPQPSPDPDWVEVVHGVVGAAHLPGADETPHDSHGEEAPMSSNGRRWREAKPYDGAEIDGHLSLNSYAATAVFGLSSLAAEQLASHEQKVGPSTVKALTGVFASVVLDAQAEVTNGSRDWQEGSNTRMRGLLRTALEIMPVPFGADAEGWQAWMTRVQRFLVAVSATALDLYDNGPATNLDVLVETTTKPTSLQAAA